MSRIVVRIPAALLALAFALVLPALPAAQSGPRVTSRLERGVLKMGQRTVLVVQVEGTDQASLGAVPSVDGLRIGTPSAPSTSFSTTIINGRRRSSTTMTWSVPIRPEREGEFEIPPIVILLGNDVLRTNAHRLTVVNDMRGEELGFLEVRPSTTKLVQGQVFSIETVFGWDQALSQIDLADLSLGFWSGMPGLLEVEADFPPRGASVMSGVTVNRSEEVRVEQLGTREVRGRPFHAFRLVRTFVATRSERIEVPPSFLNFASTASTGSFFSSRREKVEDYYVSGSRFYLEVEELPEEGRPFDFTGAIGALVAGASVDRRDVDAGDSIKLTVTWEGEANFEFFEAPDIARQDAFEGFRVYGRTEDRDANRREVVYDLAPLSAAVDEIPPVRLPVFDPGRRAYTSVATEAVPIRVRALAGAVDLAGRDGVVDAYDLRDIDTRALGPIGTQSDVPPSDELVLVALFGAPIGWLLLRTWVRRRGDPSAPLERRRRGARRRLARALARASTPDEELAALQAFLAERTREPEGAWVGRDVERELRGRVDEAATRAGALVERLEGAVWGRAGATESSPEGAPESKNGNGRAASAGPAGGVGRAEILRVADALIERGL